MANGIEITASGNLGSDIELRYSQSGTAWASFSVGVSEYKPGRGGSEGTRDTEWINCKIFGESAERLAESTSKGDRVVVQGKLRTEEWTDNNTNQKRSRQVLIIDEAAVSVRFATAKVTRAERSQGGNYGSPQRQAPAPAAQSNSPWEASPAAEDDPFAANPFGG